MAKWFADLADSPIVKKAVKILVLIVFALLLLLVLTNQFKGELEMQQKMAPCPGTPNCISSLSDAEYSKIASLSHSGEVAAGLSKLIAIIQQMPRTKIIEQNNEYVHAEVRSKWFRFIDDLEIQWDSSAQGFQIRSASRTGKSDFGVNRARIESIRIEFNR